MAIRLNGSTSGYIEIDAPAVAGTTAITLPATSGGNFVVTDSAGDLNIDSGTFFVDASTNRVGMGTTSPGRLLHVSAASGDVPARLQTATTGAYIEFKDSTTTAGREPLIGALGDSILAYTSDGSSFSEKVRIDSSGRVGIGTSSPGSFNGDMDDLVVGTGSGNRGVTIYSGTSSTGNITFHDAANTSLSGMVRYEHSSDAMSFWTNGTNRRLTIDSSGNVGIGVTSPDNRLHVFAGDSSGSSSSQAQLTIENSGNSGLQFLAGTSSVSEIRFGDSGDNGAGSIAYSHSDNSIRFGTNNGTEKVRIDSNGKIGIGVSSPYADVDIACSTEETTNTLAAHGIRLQAVGAGDEEVIPVTATFVDNQARSRAGIGFISKQASSVNGYAGAIGFYTRSSADGNGLYRSDEKVRINEGGEVGIGTTSPGALLQIGDSSSGNGTPQIRLHRGSGSDYLNIDCSGGSAHLNVVGGGYMNLTMGGTDKLRVRDDGDTAVYTTRTDGTCIQADSSGAANTTAITFAGKHSSTGVHTGTLSFKVTTNGNVTNTNNSYGSLSDIKLKENIVDAGSQWDDLKAIQVRNYNFKEETGHQTHTQLGVIAQEVELVSPGLVTETPDRDDDNNDLGTTTKSVNYSVLYMKAVKALQEAMERIETLEAKVAALEAN